MNNREVFKQFLIRQSLVDLYIRRSQQEFYKALRKADTVLLEVAIIAVDRLSGTQATKTGQRIAQEIKERLIESRRNQLDPTIRGFLDELRQLASDQIGFNTALARQVVDGPVPEVPEDETDLEAFPMDGRTIDEWWALFFAGDADRIMSAVQQGVLAGDDASEIFKNLRGTESLRYADGAVRPSFLSLATLIPTLIAGAISYGNTVFAETQDTVVRERYTAIRDNRTSILCFPGTVDVDSMSGMEALYRSYYRGDMVVVDLASGNKLEGTPNHPVLTQFGWTPLKELDPLKHVVYSVEHQSVEVVGDKEVHMPAPFSEVYDSVSHNPLVNVVGPKRTSATDFYGDGVGMYGKVDIIGTKRHLGRCGISSGNQRIINPFLGLIKFCRRFKSFGFSIFSLFGRNPSIKAPKTTPGRSKGTVEPRLTPSKTHDNFYRPKTRLKKRNSLFSVLKDKIISNASWSAPEESVLLQHVRDGRGGGFVIPSDTTGGFPLAVSAENIVGVSCVFRSCHVYTLQSCQGYYTANGIIVKNCASLDGNIYNVGEGPHPPVHRSCRSYRVPVFEGAGDAEPRVDYEEWLKNQPESVQAEVLGKAKAALFRTGKLPLKDMLRRDGTPLTLQELFERQKQLFKEAGIYI